MRYGKGVLLFSNCKSRGRNNLHLRASVDEGKTWTDGILIEKGGAYSDITCVGKDRIGIVYEGAGYSTINFVTVPVSDIKAQFN